MLELRGMSITETTTSVNPEFLMTIMEKNEEIDNAGQDREKIIKLIEENKKVLNALTK